MSKVKLYHGSLDPRGIEKVNINIPTNFKCRSNLDFGIGFYLTPWKDQACEWAVRNNSDGSLNTYILDLTGLKILNLDPLTTPPLFWLGEILKHRNFPDLEDEELEVINEKWNIDTRKYDVIIGYTADDSYRNIIDDFLTNRISYNGLCKALLRGGLGHQYVLKSMYAYDNLQKYGKSRVVYKNTYYHQAQQRYNDASYYHSLLVKECKKHRSQELFFQDIVELDIDPDDKRLVSIIHKPKEDL